MTDATPDITSTANPTLKAVARLRKKRDGVLLIDGARALSLAVKNGVTVQTVYLSEQAGPEEQRAAQNARRHGAAITTVATGPFGKIAYGNRPDGLVAVAAVPDTALSTFRPAENPLVLVLVEVEKPGNLGALLRTADGVGAAVIVADPACDPFGPNVVRASRGTLFSVPLAVAGSEAALAWLGEHRIPLAAALPEGEVVYTDAPLSGPVAIALGAEHNGLPPRWRQAARLGLTIPMRGAADSLNVATSGAILLYEALRQRFQG